jgi:hypothetical protein
MRRSKLLIIFMFPVALAFAFFTLFLLDFAAEFAFPSLYPSCIDCHAHVGFPFAYLDTGGRGLPPGGLLLFGAIGDSLIALLIAFSLTLLIWKRIRN